MRAFKNILLIALVILLLTNSVVASGNSTVQPRYTYMNSVSASLTINESKGEATCVAAATAWTCSSVKITCLLQRYQNGGWQTIKTWSDTDSDIVTVDNTWIIEQGYKYRLRAVGYALDSSNTVLESVTQYSKTYDYS